MSLATLSERLEFDAAERAKWANVARNPVFVGRRIRNYNCSIRAEPLGNCGLTPRVPYEIYSFERREPSNIIVHFVVSALRSYQLPENYAMMVSRRDIAIINSNLYYFTLTRAVKHCGLFRLPFDDKPYTWQLVLKQLPRISNNSPGNHHGQGYRLFKYHIYILVVFISENK